MEIDYTRKITHTGYRNPEKVKKYFHRVPKNIYEKPSTFDKGFKKVYLVLEDFIIETDSSDTRWICIVMSIFPFSLVAVLFKNVWNGTSNYEFLFYIALLVGIFMVVYGFTMPKQEAILNRRDGLITFDGFLWQKKDKGLAKMNPETFEITHYDLTKDLPTEIIDNRTMAYHNGIIAVSAKPERDSIRSLVLLFDTNTGKIIWRKEILHNESKPSNNENRRQIEEIQMNDKYLAVSTTGFSLYIFESK